jgi:hypothetical protein
VSSRCRETPENARSQLDDPTMVATACEAAVSTHSSGHGPRCVRGVPAQNFELKLVASDNRADSAPRLRQLGNPRDRLSVKPLRERKRTVRCGEDRPRKRTDRRFLLRRSSRPGRVRPLEVPVRPGVGRRDTQPCEARCVTPRHPPRPGYRRRKRCLRIVRVREPTLKIDG